MEADILSSWNNILWDFCSVCGNREIQFLKKNLIPAGGNWFSGYWKPFFLLFWNTPATAYLIFPSSGSIFNTRIRLVERDFLASGNTFFIYFSDISASDVCRYKTFMPVFFSCSGNVVLKRILHPGQWKRIFWLVEAILFQYLKYPFHWKQFFHLLEINFKRILY